MESGRHAPEVRADLEVMGGTPVFAGSRLPIATVLACVDGGEPWSRLIANWPWLTPEHVAAARAWQRCHPDTAIRRWPALEEKKESSPSRNGISGTSSEPN